MNFCYSLKIMILSLVVAVTENNIIGRANKMPWYLPADLHYFKTLTLGHTVLMGRKTYESIGRILPGRRNVIVSTRENLKISGGEVVNSVPAGLQLVKEDAMVFVIGGGMLYRQLWTLADRLYLTRIHARIAGDTYFPEIKDTFWTLVSQKNFEADTENEYAYSFMEYRRKSL